MIRDFENVNRIGVVGCGVLGRGWALQFLRLGYDVVVYDLAPDAEERTTDFVTKSWPLAERIGVREGGTPDRLTFVHSPVELAERVDFVQESGPENLAAKVVLYRELDAVLPSDVVIASSTSGLAMSDIAVQCEDIERCVVGHPFHPVYLVPLVEVVGGARTSPEVVDWAVDFYRAIEMEPVKLSSEVAGFVGNRLQEAMFREAVHMLVKGEATPEEIDRAVVYGPGTRWAWMGPLLTYHLAGGEGGIVTTLRHFKGPMVDYVHGATLPDLSDGEIGDLGAKLNELAGSLDPEALEERRDQFLLALAELRRGDVEPSIVNHTATDPEERKVGHLDD